MIGFWCNVGYFNSKAPKNISDITFLDTNVPFTIPIIKKIPTSGVIYSEKITNIWPLIDEYIGPDWYITYGDLFYRYDDTASTVEGLKRLTEIMPGWNASWANTNEYFLSLDANTLSTTFGAIYIPNLKRCLIQPSRNGVLINYKVDENGNLTLIKSGSDTTSPGSWSARGQYLGDAELFSGSCNSILALTVEYTDYNILKEESSFTQLSVYAGDARGLYDHRYMIEFGSTSSTMHYLFTDGTEPDFEGGEPPTPKPPDPYAPGGITEPDGGDGDFDNTSTPIPIPELPKLSAIDTGFISLFNPSLPQLQELANYMWSDLFDINGWKKIFADPMDAILGLSIVPVAVPDGGTRPVTVGNISTGINLTVAQSQYVEIDCGTINLNEYWGSYLDYDPYTRAEIYLPYVGTHPLAIDDIMKKTLHVAYHVDILSGACCAYIQCGESVLYSFVGQCSCSIPITGNDWTNVINGALSIAASIGTMVATGGATAPMMAGSIASAAVNSLKPNVEKSGSMGGMGGMLGVQTPYLILTRPRQALPANQNIYMGYPSFITTLLGECSGYTEVDSIHLENVPATGEELTEIESLLKNGVIM